MNIFRRHKHTWELRGRQVLNEALFHSWSGMKIAGSDSVKTTLYYVCPLCGEDHQRDVTGVITIEQAKELFPKP